MDLRQEPSDPPVPQHRAQGGGAGEGMALAFELAVTPMLFGFLGYRLDQWAGTLPLLTVVLSTFCFGYMLWRTWVGYEAEMRAHEAQLVRSRAGRRHG
ncbi:MAG: AtpZ/AtpI family protein [Acidimicrobiales bacterium]